MYLNESANATNCIEIFGLNFIAHATLREMPNFKKWLGLKRKISIIGWDLFLYAAHRFSLQEHSCTFGTLFHNGANLFVRITRLRL